MQVLLQERERPFPLISWPPSKNSIAVRSGMPSFGVEPADLGVLVGHPLVDADAVVVAALDHERPRGDQGGHLGVVERVAQVELEHLVLAGEHVAVAEVDAETFFQIHSLKSAEQIDRQ